MPEIIAFEEMIRAPISTNCASISINIFAPTPTPLTKEWNLVPIEEIGNRARASVVESLEKSIKDNADLWRKLAQY